VVQEFWQVVQSLGQSAKLSLPVQAPSPQTSAELVQSAGQVLWVSPLAQTPSPHFS